MTGPGQPPPDFDEPPPPEDGDFIPVDEAGPPPDLLDSPPIEPAELISSGGGGGFKKKRFDKAVKVGSRVILAMSDGERRLRYDEHAANRDELAAKLRELDLD